MRLEGLKSVACIQGHSCAGRDAGWNRFQRGPTDTLIIYVLAFDRPRVARILDESWGGRAYLDKIVQVSFTLPELQSAVIQRELERGWREIARATEGPFLHELERDTGTKESVLHAVVPLMETIRDVKRLNATVASLWPILESKVHPADLIVLEALRLFWPEFYGELMAVADDLANYVPAPKAKPGVPPRTPKFLSLRNRVSEAAKKAAEEQETFTRVKNLDSYIASILKFLFPQSAGHRPPPPEEKRIAHPDVLEAYLRHVPEWQAGPVMKGASVSPLAEGEMNVQVGPGTRLQEDVEGEREFEGEME